MELADLLPTASEHIGADSVQVYKGLDIGSNKSSKAERQRCPLHLVDWLQPSEVCNASVWTKEALRIADELHDRGAVPIVVGGSCMYLDWLVHGEPDAPESDPMVQSAIAEELRPYEEAADWEGAIALLAAVSPDKAARILPNNWRQLSRQLEVARAPCAKSGRSERDEYDFRCFFLSPQDRQVLFRRIDERCMGMMEKGLLEEVAGLLESGAMELETPAGYAIGYRQVINYLARAGPQDDDPGALRDFLHGFGTASRNYACQQMHWFMKDSEFMWLPADPGNPRGVAQEIAKLVQLPETAYQAEVLGGGADTCARSAQAKQGSDAMNGFVSSLDKRELRSVDLSALVKRADACTRRVPATMRQAARPPPTMVELPGAEGVVVAKIYWHGQHRRWGWGAPLGKLHKQALQLFDAAGWQKAEDLDTPLLPVFCWPVRKAGDFPAHGAHNAPLPLMRPFPHSFTRLLDNKIELATHLAAAGHADIHPPTWCAEDFLAAERLVDDESHLWFLKHSQGVKGTGVSVLAGAEALYARLEQLGEKGRRGFIVQRAVAPPALRDGRKWVLRAHVLMHGTSDELRAYCHKDVVLLEHARPYTLEPGARAAHISSAGKNWPKPVLVEEEDLLQQVQTLAARAFASVWQFAPRGPYAPAGAELCQVFGLDVAVDTSGRAWLLEVNDYPAIASGTLDHVDKAVYTNLVRDVLRLVVLPRTDGMQPIPGGFVQLQIDS
eukprot:TRINITY_DN7771_c0_g1_i1.p1 TRINITY_DN7771_c0_g1~~TRINITY_DN7771_c0_g1_i1.p1  ORF type:complete len:853 (-),score=194.80 TRINITY_DN7771_c0_g1_i1:167-2344(-)